MYFLVNFVQRFEVVCNFLENFDAFRHYQGVISDWGAEELDYVRTEFAQVICLLNCFFKTEFATLNFLNLRPFIFKPLMFVQYRWYWDFEELWVSRFILAICDPCIIKFDFLDLS